MATAVTVLWDAYVSINGVDRSEQVKSVSLPMTIAQLDAACMGIDTSVFEPGLKGFTCEIELLSDFTDDEDDEDFFALWDGRTKFAVVLRPDKTTVVGTGNPEYQFSAFISNWAPLAGAHGELSGGPMTLTNTTVMTRATT